MSRKKDKKTKIQRFKNTKRQKIKKLKNKKETKRQKPKKTKRRQGKKKKRPEREFYIATSGQFRTLAIFSCPPGEAAILKTGLLKRSSGE